MQRKEGSPFFYHGGDLGRGLLSSAQGGSRRLQQVQDREREQRGLIQRGAGRQTGEAGVSRKRDGESHC